MNWNIVRRIDRTALLPKCGQDYFWVQIFKECGHKFKSTDKSKYKPVSEGFLGLKFIIYRFIPVAIL